MCDIVFKKVQGRSWKVNRTSAYAEAEFTKNICAAISIFIKLNSVDLQLH